MMNIRPAILPKLDPTFAPASLWEREFLKAVDECDNSVPVKIALIRPDQTCSIFSIKILPQGSNSDPLNLRVLERTVKFLLWQKGGATVLINGCDALTQRLADIYSNQGARAFDYDFFSHQVYSQPLRIDACSEQDFPEEKERASLLGGNLNGCRIGFDLGGSDRKCAAVIDGKVVFAEEIPWSPYFETDPAYHLEGIRDSLRRAAEHLPHVDAIGGSAAGVYVNNEVRAGSLFRGVSKTDFEEHVRTIFFNLKSEWKDVPFEVVNDGEVTALAGYMSLNKGSVLGVSMGTSQAVGYCNSEGHITNWLNELAFTPIDYREDAPQDEWSGDCGCGAQYFSQQGVARLAEPAGFSFTPEIPLAERLVEIQSSLTSEDPKAKEIFQTIGTCFGYALAHYASYYDLENVLILGRVTSGDGGQLIVDHAREVLQTEYPALGEQISISMPDEAMKRHGQAVAAASLPEIK